jgi:hypothetical protein
MYAVILMESAHNNMITDENKAVEVNEDDRKDFEDVEPVYIKIVRIPKTPIKIKENKVGEINEDEIQDVEDVESITHKVKATKASKSC